MTTKCIIKKTIDFACISKLDSHEYNKLVTISTKNIVINIWRQQ